VTTCLLDVNVLLALSDPMHVHHDVAHKWFNERGRQAWATCPLTENGFVRIASHPSYPNRPGDVTAVPAILEQFCRLEGHHFWSEHITIRDLIEPDVIVAHSQITDIYLLGLAVHAAGKLATLNQKIPAQAVAGGPDALELI
jgi:uncharacterized protein